MEKYLNNFLQDWGYQNYHDFMTSVVHYKSTKQMIALSLPLSYVSTIVDRYLGLDLAVYVSFLLLLAIEFFTGIMASVKEGKKIESRKFGRFIIKCVVYTSMIGIVNVMGSAFSMNKFGGLYDFIYWVIIHLITIQLIISVFENMSRLGFQESSTIFRKINKHLSKVLDLKDDEEETKTENK